MRIEFSRVYRYANAVGSVDKPAEAVELRLLKDHISVILAGQISILTVADYFFCPLSLAYGTVGFPGAEIFSAALRLGHLSIGWRHGMLREKCPNCEGDVLVVAFGGNVKYSDSCWWRGLCLNCQEWMRSRATVEDTWRRAHLVGRIVSRVPEYVEKLEQFAAYEFAWSGAGLRPTTRSRYVVKELFQPVPFDVLVHELRAGVERVGKPPVVRWSARHLVGRFGAAQK